MSLLKTALIGSVAGISLASGWQYYRQESRAQEATQLQADNTRLRGMIMQKSLAATPTAVTSGSGVKVAAAADLPGNDSIPTASADSISALSGDYRNEGWATPLKALQTFAWACDHADTGLIEKMIVYDPAARTKASAYVASLPPATQAQWPSLESFAAAVFVSESIKTPFPAAAVLQQSNLDQISAERVALLLPDTVRPRIEFLNTPTGWKYIITEAMVDDYIKETAQGH